MNIVKAKEILAGGMIYCKKCPHDVYQHGLGGCAGLIFGKHEMRELDSNDISDDFCSCKLDRNDILLNIKLMEE